MLDDVNDQHDGAHHWDVVFGHPQVSNIIIVNTSTQGNTLTVPFQLSSLSSLFRFSLQHLPGLVDKELGIINQLPYLASLRFFIRDDLLEALVDVENILEVLGLGIYFVLGAPCQ